MDILTVKARENPEGGVSVDLWSPTIGLQGKTFTGPSFQEVWSRVDAVIRTIIDTTATAKSTENGEGG